MGERESVLRNGDRNRNVAAADMVCSCIYSADRSQSEESSQGLSMDGRMLSVVRLVHIGGKLRKAVCDGPPVYLREFPVVILELHTAYACGTAKRPFDKHPSVP